MIKKILFFIILVFAFVQIPCSCKGLDDTSYMSLDEYSNLFEMYDDDNDIQTQDEFKPGLKEKLNLTGKDVISPDAAPIELHLEKNEIFTPIKEVYEPVSSSHEIFSEGKFSIFSQNSKEMSDYMTTDWKSSANASYSFNKNFTLNAGQETKYVNPDASLGSRKLYVNPHFNLTDRVYLDYTGRYNQNNGNIEQEVGVNYKPKFLKNAANFGMKASSVSNEDNGFQSGRLKFTSDLFLF